PGFLLPALGEGMDRQKHRRRPAGEALVDHAIDGAMVGFVVKAPTPLPFVIVKAVVRWDHGTVREAHNEGGIVRTAVGIDEQPGVTCQDSGHAKRGGEAARDFRGSDVVGDVALKLLRREPQAAVGGWNSIASMVAKQDEARIDPPPPDAIAVVLLQADGLRPR